MPTSLLNALLAGRVKAAAEQQADGPSALSILAPTWLGSAAIAGGHRIGKDIDNTERAAELWERNMRGAAADSRWRRDKLQAMGDEDFFNAAQEITDTYIRDGRNTAQQKLLGLLPIGKLPILKAKNDLRKAIAGSVDAVARDAQIAALRKQTDARINHYRIFANEHIAPADLRGHMNEKAITGLDPYIVEQLPASVRNVLTLGGDSLNRRIERLKELPVGAFGEGVTEQAKQQRIDETVKMMRQALLGTGDTKNVHDLGELGRLTGKPGLALSTPAVYRHASAPALQSLRRGGKGLMGAGAGLLGLAAFRGLDRLRDKGAEKNAATAEDDHETLRGLAAAGMLGASPLSAAYGINELKRKDLNRIGITYGQQKLHGAMIGGGHKEPADAIFKALEAEAKRKGYTLDRFVRGDKGILGVQRPDGVIDFDQNRLAKQQGVNVMINTGFGDYTPASSRQDLKFTAEGRLQSTPLQSRIKTMTLANYLTDLTPEDQANFGATGKDRNRHGRTIMYGYGDGFEKHKGKARSVAYGKTDRLAQIGHYTGVNQLMHALGLPTLYSGAKNMGSELPFAVDEDKLKGLEALRQPGHAEKLLRDYAYSDIEDASTAADPAIKSKIRQVMDAKQAGKKVIVVSGASRGDYVASRVAELAQHLKDAGRDDIHIVAQMSGAFQDPKQMKLLEGLGPNVTTFARMEPAQFRAMQSDSIADKHWNNTGANSHVEALLMGRNNVQPREWGFHESYPEHYPTFVDDKPDMHGAIDPEMRKQKSVARRLRDALKANDPNVDELHGQAGIGGWNRGALHHQQTNGRMLADTAEELVKLVDEGKLNPDNLSQLSASVRKGRSNFVDSIFREARRNKILSRGKGVAGILSGLALPALAAKTYFGGDKKKSFEESRPKFGS